MVQYSKENLIMFVNNKKTLKQIWTVLFIFTKLLFFPILSILTEFALFRIIRIMLDQDIITNITLSSVSWHIRQQLLFFISARNYIWIEKMLKGTVSVISNDLPFIKKHVQFTTIPIKPLFEQGFRRYSYL